jgi:glycosyltransferase involved in cell wall biosynthesis
MRPLRIAVDAHRLLCEPLTSGATYLEALVTEWQSGENPPELDLLFPYRPPAILVERPPYATHRANLVQPSRPAAPTSRYWEQLRWQLQIIPALLKRRRPDVYFSPFHLTPQLPLRLPVVTAIHDLCFLVEPFFDLGSLVRRAEIYSACLRARKLICVSEFTAGILTRWAPRTAKRATVVQNGIAGRLLTLAEAVDHLRTAGLNLSPANYLLWIGHPSPRKNPELLLEIFAAFHKQNEACEFVIVAPQSTHEQLKSLAQRHNIGHRMRLLSGIDSETRDALYRCALALIFPSRCEGFGYPVLEAMHQGCPAFATRNGPAPEIIGGLLRLATKPTANDFMGAISSYLALPETERLRLSAALSSRASSFSARRMARETLEVLMAAAGPRRTGLGET